MQEQEKGVNFKDLFIPITPKKAILWIIAIGLIVYFNMLFNEFVWDDKNFILNSPDIHSVNIAFLFGKNIFNIFSYYRPITALYFAILYNLFGAHAFFYHFIQLALHIICSILVFILLRKLFSRNNAQKSHEVYLDNLTGSQRVKYLRKLKENNFSLNQTKDADNFTNILALFLALIFLVHPIQVESVTYIASSQSELFFVFGMSALLISMRNKVYLKHLFLISGLILISLLAKETGFLFMLMILVSQYLFYKSRFLKILFCELIVLFSYFFIRFTIGGVFFSRTIFQSPIPIASLTLLERLANIPTIFLYYLNTTLFPLKLTVDQLWIFTKLTIQAFYMPLIFISLFFIFLVYGGICLFTNSRKYFKNYLFFVLWFIFGIVMILQIFPLDMTVSDRWFYFPILGLLGVLGVIIDAIFLYLSKRDFSLSKFKKVKMASVSIGVILILLLSIRTVIRNRDFRDDITLYSHDAQVQDSFILESVLGANYAQRGDFRDGIVHLQKSVNLYPYAYNLYILGYCYEYSGNIQKALENYYRAYNYLTTNTTIGYSNKTIEQEIYIKLAGMLLLSGKYESASFISRNGIQHFPTASILYEELAVSEYMLDNKQNALAAIQTANNIYPNQLSVDLNGLMISNRSIPQGIIKLIIDQ